MKKSALVGILVFAMASSVHAQARRRNAPVVTRPAGSAAALLGYQQPKADGTRSCSCNELQRRLTGLEAIVKAGSTPAFASSFPKEAPAIAQAQSALRSQIQAGRDLYGQAGGKSFADQERLCGEALGKVDSGWQQWQPFLAQQGMDSDYYTGVKASYPTVPDAGDLEPNDKGRQCDRGQWWEEDRALWALNGREGICSQSRYRIKQVLRGSPGDVGHRCFEYELK